jgi:hypothetical protein
MLALLAFASDLSRRLRLYRRSVNPYKQKLTRDQAIPRQEQTSNPRLEYEPQIYVIESPNTALASDTASIRIGR